jgi:hypothetical protein
MAWQDFSIANWTPVETSDASDAFKKGWRMPGLIFPQWQGELLKTILTEKKLRFDREGRPRSLQCCATHPSSICLRLMEGADI